MIIVYNPLRLEAGFLVVADHGTLTAGYAEGKKIKAHHIAAVLWTIVAKRFRR